MKFPGFQRKQSNAQLSEQEIAELLHTANNEGIKHEKPSCGPIVEEQKTNCRDGNTWKDKKEARYEDNE